MPVKTLWALAHWRKWRPYTKQQNGRPMAEYRGPKRTICSPSA